MLFKDGGEYSMGEICKDLFISRPNVTAIVDHLINKNLVVRGYCKTDRRVVNISLSDQGKKLRNKIDRARCETIGKMAGKVPLEEMFTIVKGLESMVKSLDEMFVPTAEK